MGRVWLALLLLAVWLMPTYSAAQSNSLPLTAFGPTYERVPRSSRQVVPGWYAVGDASDVVDPSPVTSRYMSRGDIDPVPRYSPGRTPLVVPRSAYPGYLDRTLTRISYRPMFVPVYYSVPAYFPSSPVSYTRYRSFGYVIEPAVASSPAVYVILGCYMGDAPPLRSEKLPTGCKIEKLKRVYY